MENSPGIVHFAILVLFQANTKANSDSIVDTELSIAISETPP